MDHTEVKFVRVFLQNEVFFLFTGQWTATPFSLGLEAIGSIYLKP